VISWFLIVMALLSGGALCFFVAFDDMGWQLVQLLIVHEGALILAIMVRVAIAVEDKNEKPSALVIPSNDAAAGELVRQLMKDLNGRFFNSFAALPREERLERDGVRCAYVHKKFCYAIKLLEEAQEIVRGDKTVTLADREAREAAIQLAGIIRNLDPAKISGPMAGQEPTIH
jgi:hypothetical protein